MEAIERKIFTIDDLREEIEHWRINKNPRKAFFRSLLETPESSIAFLIFFILSYRQSLCCRLWNCLSFWLSGLF
jgi:hypothetical protein